jgi:hypothetical protein
MRKYSFNFCFIMGNLRKMILTDKLIHSVRTQALFPGCDYPSSNWYDKTVRVIPQYNLQSTFTGATDSLQLLDRYFFRVWKSHINQLFCMQIVIIIWWGAFICSNSFRKRNCQKMHYFSLCNRLFEFRDVFISIKEMNLHCTDSNQMLIRRNSSSHTLKHSIFRLKMIYTQRETFPYLWWSSQELEEHRFCHSPEVWSFLQEFPVLTRVFGLEKKDIVINPILLLE